MLKKRLKLDPNIATGFLDCCIQTPSSAIYAHAAQGTECQIHSTKNKSLA